MTTMPAEGKVCYIGSDFEFELEMKKFFTEKSRHIQCMTDIYSPGSLVSLCTSQQMDIIFIDFSEPEFEVNKLIHETLSLKRVSQLKSVLLVALFMNEDQKAKNNIIFTSGFQLSFVKGSESESIFRDSFYIGLRNKMEFPILALARNINLDLEIGICSTITGMNKDEFRIETDVEGLKDHLKLSMPMFPELKCNSFKIKETSGPSYQYPMTSGYVVAYPFAGPWTDDSEENIQPETVETWLDNYESEFSRTRKTYVRIYSNNLTIVDELFEKQDPSVQINIGNDSNNLDAEIFIARPSLIFVHLDDEDTEEGQVTLKMLEFLLSVSFGIDYRPIIVVTNCSSSGAALQKAYNYPMIVATQNILDSTLCLTMIKKFQAKRQDNVSPAQDFKVASEQRSIDVFENVKITSLTEHEVTFNSELELPMFTVIHFSLPIEFHATIVPTILPLQKKNDTNQYMAFIHGLSEEQMMVLRKFVNQIIYTPLKDFSDESVKSALGEALIQKESIQLPATVAPEKKPEIVTNKVLDLKKYNFSGKSKL